MDRYREAFKVRSSERVLLGASHTQQDKQSGPSVAPEGSVWTGRLVYLFLDRLDGLTGDARLVSPGD